MRIAYFFFLFFLLFLSIPSGAFAWGPLTHVYLGTEVFFLGSFIPASVLGLIRRFRQDFIYGNLMADFVIGKKYLPKDKNSHSWDVAIKLMDASTTGSEEAFSLGYMSHLAADTVAHDIYTKGSKNIKHAYLEMKADSMIDRRYWMQAMAIERKVQARNDRFLEMSVPGGVIFSFKTNKRLFKGMVVLSGINKEAMVQLMDRNPLITTETNIPQLRDLHYESLDRIVDVLGNGRDSHVIGQDPNCTHSRGKLARLFLN